MSVVRAPFVRSALASTALAAVVLATAFAVPAHAGGRHCRIQGSGLQPGADAPAFEPRHVTGPDTGRRTCPMCAYGRTSGVLVFVGADDEENVVRLARRLEEEAARLATKGFRVFLVDTNAWKRPAAEVEKRLQALAERAGLRNVALSYLSGPGDPALSDYRIDAEAKNTVFVYAAHRVRATFVDVDAATGSAPGAPTGPGAGGTLYEAIARL